jgi:hypothetical protein
MNNYTVLVSEDNLELMAISGQKKKESINNRKIHTIISAKYSLLATLCCRKLPTRTNMTKVN